MSDTNYVQSNINNTRCPQSLSDLIVTFKKNFLEQEIEIVPGLMFNQYETIKRTYFYMHNQFQSGPTDDNGDPKYFYDLVTHRNDQATKNINIDTKDVYIKSETKGTQVKSWLLRREYMVYAKSTGWGKKLNTIADDLPDFGTVVWKKIKKDGRVDVKQVELINLMNDPKVDCLKDGMVIERHLLTQDDMRGKKSWNQEVVQKLIQSGRTVSNTAFLDTQTQATNSMKRIDTTTPFYEAFELWGEIPYSLYEKHRTGGIPRKNTSIKIPEKKTKSSYGVNTSEHYKQNTEPETVSYDTSHSNETVYVLAIVAGVDSGKPDQECVLFCQEADRELFPYKEVHFRRRKGRWLGVGNFEQCFPIIEKANELTNRFFASLRIALLHLFQTRDNLHVKNVMTDLLDGDVVVSKSELTVIPTEIRGASEYKLEMNNIETLADKLCNSYEVVTGADLPSGTSFKLGSQQLKSATKLFEFVRENMGLFIEEVFNDWMLPDFAKSLTKEHILELLDDADDIQVYYNAKRKIYQYEVLKRYIMDNNEYPDPEQLKLVGELVKDQIAKGSKQLQIENDYYSQTKYGLKVVTTGENDNKKESLESVSSLVQVAMANPQGLQDPRLMKLVNIVLEQSGYSPLEINSINETPTNPLLNPAMQGGNGAERSMTGAPGAEAPQPGQVVNSK